MSPIGELKEPELLTDLAAHVSATVRDLMEVSPEIADMVGSEVAGLMAQNWGGQVIYVPAGIFYRVSKLHQEIYERFNGRNHNELAKEFHVSRQWIYRVVKRMRAADLAKRQGNLFEPPCPTE